MSMADRDGWIWYDGKMVPWRDATTHVLTHTLHYLLKMLENMQRLDAEWHGEDEPADAETPAA